MSFQTQKNNYLRQITAISKTCGVYHKPIIKRLKADLEDYLYDHPAATDEAIQRHFGCPEDYVKEFLSGMTSKELAQNLAAKRFWRKLVMIVSAVFLTLVIALGLWVGIRNRQTMGVSFSYEVFDEGTIPIQERNSYG